MTSYNKLNGVHCSADKFLITDIFRKRWRFKGLVVCDWGLSPPISTLQALQSGLNLEMPSGVHYNADNILPLIHSGQFSIAGINALVRPILRMIVAMRLINHTPHKSSIALNDLFSDHIAYEIEKQGAVLLKNKNQVLPLSAATHDVIVVVGPNARSLAKASGNSWNSLSPFEGGGSSYTQPIVKPVSMFTAIKKLAPVGTDVVYLPTVDSVTDQAILRKADAVIACVGLNASLESEGIDHPYAPPAPQNTLIEQAAKLNSHVIVILNGGGNVAMRHWIHQIAGLLDAWYPGQNGNLAVAGIVFGKIDTSGRLPETFEKRWRDAPAYGHYPGHNNTVHFAEGIYLGYRWFDKMKIAPRYPFGYGLSYTTFSMDHLRVTSSGAGKQRTLEVTVQVTDTGKMNGAQVVQLYVHPLVDRLNRCVQTLKGFTRVHLQPRRSKTVRMKLDWRDFACYNTAGNNWKVPPGNYQIAVGSSSADEPLHTVVRW